MVKPIKTPSERGLTASTDTRIVRREFDGMNMTPGCIKTGVIYKDISPNDPILALASGSPPRGAYTITLGGPGSVPVAPPPPAPVLPPGQIATSTLVAGTISSSSMSTSHRLSNIVVTGAGYREAVYVEWVLQQAWYGPSYTDKEWHDAEFVDLVLGVK